MREELDLAYRIAKNVEAYYYISTNEFINIIQQSNSLVNSPLVQSVISFLYMKHKISLSSLKDSNLLSSQILQSSIGIEIQNARKESLSYIFRVISVNLPDLNGLESYILERLPDIIEIILQENSNNQAPWFLIKDFAGIDVLLKHTDFMDALATTLERTSWLPEWIKEISALPNLLNEKKIFSAIQQRAMEVSERISNAREPHGPGIILGEIADVPYLLSHPKVQDAAIQRADDIIESLRESPGHFDEIRALSKIPVFDSLRNDIVEAFTFGFDKEDFRKEKHRSAGTTIKALASYPEFFDNEFITKAIAHTVLQSQDTQEVQSIVRQIPILVESPLFQKLLIQEAKSNGEWEQLYDFLKTIPKVASSSGFQKILLAAYSETHISDVVRGLESVIDVLNDRNLLSYIKSEVIQSIRTDTIVNIEYLLRGITHIPFIIEDSEVTATLDSRTDEIVKTFRYIDQLLIWLEYPFIAKMESTRRIVKEKAEDIIRGFIEGRMDRRYILWILKTIIPDIIPESTIQKVLEKNTLLLAKKIKNNPENAWKVIKAFKDYGAVFENEDLRKEIATLIQTSETPWLLIDRIGEIPELVKNQDIQMAIRDVINGKAHPGRLYIWHLTAESAKAFPDLWNSLSE